MDFPRFLELPYELRRLVWVFTLPHREPEVCIIKPENLPKPESEHPPTESLTVYTSFPIIMHVCHEARQLASREYYLRGIRFVPNHVTKSMIPVCDFNPAFDILYWPAPQYMDFSIYLNGYNGISPALDAATARQLRHLAIEWGMMHSLPLRFVEYIMESCPALKSIAVVFPHVPGKNSWTDSFPAPGGRSKLRTLDDVEQQKIDVVLQDPGEMDWYASLIPNARGPYAISADGFLATLRKTLDAHAATAVRMAAQSGQPAAWNAKTNQIDGLELIPQMFVEYRNGRWDEETRSEGIFRES